MSPKPKIYIHRVGPAYSRYMNPANEAALAEFAEVISDGPTDALRSPDDLIQRVRGCSAILSLAGGWTDEFTPAVLTAIGTVNVICIAHWGGQLVDAARAAKIPTVEGSDANTRAVAEWTLTAALMGTRRLHVFDSALKSGSPWAEPRYDAGLLCDATIGILGLGRIGAHVARTFNTLGARVLAYDPYWTQDRANQLNVQLVPLHDLLRTATIISLHLPVTSETRNILGPNEFALIQNDAILINSARAALYEESTLLAELKKYRFTAYLDVFAHEPLPLNHPLRQLNNVILTPHIAGDNRAMFLRCGREAIETLRDYFAGRPLRDFAPRQ